MFRGRVAVAMVVLVAVTVLAAACGSSSSKATGYFAGGSIEGHPVSKQAAMICQPEAAKDLATDLVQKTTSTPEPGWDDGDFTCRYRYAHGATLLMSVRDLGTDAKAAAYLSQLGRTLGRSDEPIQFGTQGAFTTPKDNVVVQKDSHVLVVDVSGLPKTWSSPPLNHLAAGEIVAAAIMDCWKGDS